MIQRIAVIIAIAMIPLLLIAQGDLAPLRVTTNSEPIPGFLYLAPNSRVSPRPYGAYLGVYNVNGGVVKTRKTTNFPFEYKILPDGRLGYSELIVFSGASSAAGVFIVDTLFMEQEKLRSNWKYVTTQHDFAMLRNGHRIVLGVEDVVMDMSKLVPNGHPAAVVVQAVIQEQDPLGNVLRIWRSLDHIPVTDSYENLEAPSIRYIHNNAFWEDDDGNWLLSMRHTSNILKINSTTGEVMWTLGGKRNEFAFIDEHETNAPYYFSYQHDIRRLPNGHISMFDNGSQRTPQYSRGVEYEIDEANKTCKMIWEYRPNPDIYVSIQGGMQTLDSGHRIIGWGSAANDGTAGVTEVDSNGTIVFEAFYPKQMYVYRATKYPVWPPGRPAASVQIRDVLQGETYRYTKNDRGTGLRVSYPHLESFFYNMSLARRFMWSPKNPVWQGEPPIGIQAHADLLLEGVKSHRLNVRFHVDTFEFAHLAENITVYHRPIIDSGTFSPLPTRYNQVTRELEVDDVQGGEFAFGIVRSDLPSAQIPQLQWPIGGRRIRAGAENQLRLALQGRVDSVRIQVAEDISMLAVVRDSTVRNDRIVLDPSVPSRKYYWRSMAFVGGRATPWCGVDSFNVGDPFLAISSPMKDAKWTLDSNYVISWETNITGSLRLELVKNDVVVALIRDSVDASVLGFLWLVSSFVPEGMNYHVRLTPREAEHANLATTGSANIEITYTVSVDDSELAPIVAVYPQPAFESVTVHNPYSGLKRVHIFSITGELVQSIECSEARVTINVSEFETGIWMLALEDNLGRTYIQPFIKQR